MILGHVQLHKLCTTIIHSIQTQCKTNANCLRDENKVLLTFAYNKHGLSGGQKTSMDCLGGGGQKQAWIALGAENKHGLPGG